MKIVVTGANGFVGMALCEAFAATGDRVLGVDVSTSRADKFNELSHSSQSVDFVTCDITDPKKIQELVGKSNAEILVHAAAIAPSTEMQFEFPSRTVAVNCLGTTNILHAAHTARIPRVIVVSSASVYGDSKVKSGFLSEADSLPIPKSVYGLSKYFSESLARLYNCETDLSVVCTRLGSIFGPWEIETGVRDTLSPMYQVLANWSSGTPSILPREGKRDWTYSRDMARAVVELSKLKNPRYDLYNIAASPEWTIEAWCKELNTVLGAVEWNIADSGQDANVDFHSIKDRPPLDTKRIVGEVGAISTTQRIEQIQDHVKWYKGLLSLS